MTSRILLAGYYGAGNTGDEAILTALLQDLRALRPALEFVVVSARPAETAARYGVSSIPATDISAIIDAGRASDAILLGGGGVFHDYWGCPSETILTRDHGGIPFYAGFPLLAALTARPCMIYAAGVGPLFSEEGRRLTRMAFAQASLATVRDEASRDLLHAIGAPCADVRVTADPAFTLQPDLDQARVILSRLCPDRRAPLVAVCVRGWQVDGPPGQWEGEVAGALDAFIEETGAFVVFVPLQTVTEYFLTDDLGAADRVMDRMAKGARAAVLREPHGPQVIAGVLAECDLVVGMRLHSLIFAASAGVPAVGLIYDAKVASLMTRLGIEEYSVTLAGLAGLAGRMSTAWACRDAIRTQLARVCAQLRDLAAETAELAIGLIDSPSSRPAHAPAVEWLSAFALTQTQRLAEQQTRTETVSAQADALANQLSTLTGNDEWRAAEHFGRARRRFAPPGSRRDRAVRLGLRSAVTLANKGLVASGRSLLPAAREWLARPRGVWALDYHQETFGTVTLYTDRADLFPDHSPRKALSAPRNRRVRVSLIATVRNERDSISRWMASVAAQTRAPDEIIIVDAGSTDGTPEEIMAQAARVGLTVRVPSEPHANIARGRNAAIEHARGPIVAATDLGCRLTPTWLDRIVAPFENDEAMQVVAGWYVALEGGRPRQRQRWPTLDQVDPGQFLPSSRSIAFTREAWAAVDGYPEWLTLTGEDTWFALELRRFCDRWAFVPEAVVEWDAPTTMMEYWRKIHAWSTGDGESGVAARLYWKSVGRVARVAAGGAVVTGVVGAASALGRRPALLALGGSGVAVAAVLEQQRKSLGSLQAVAWEAGAHAARAIGFLRGAGRRREVAARRHRSDRGMAFILSGVPIDDTGGGARCTQLALELLKQGWFVVFLNRFPRYESKSLELRIRHPRLLAAALDDFPWRRFLSDHAQVFQERAAVAIVEFPVPEFVPLARAIRSAGGSVVYDLLDNWDSALGGDWYSPSVERKIIALSDVLIATAAPLATRLSTMSDRDVTLVPNAVNTDLFDPGKPWTRPADYPKAVWSMIYIGALWGDWFDWDLLRRLSATYSEAAVVVIGDYRGQMTPVPYNVHFLGLKAQTELPAYLVQAEVAIIPWKANAVTHATSPLKVYEYLAMRRPVVAPRLDALAGIPGVLLSSDTEAFVRNVGRARGLPLDVDTFVRDNSWAARVETLMQQVARANPRMRGNAR